jgi:prephenate dehydrogenase
MWNTVAIIGVGLIGGSIGLALRSRGLAQKVIGVGRTTQRLQTAQHVGALSSFTTDLSQGVADAQLVVVCTPVETIVEYVRRIRQLCPVESLITDAGSTKGEICRALAPGSRDADHFVTPSTGGTPVAPRPSGGTPVAPRPTGGTPVAPELASELQGTAHFVGSHPMAGSEKSGPEFADAGLFEDSLTIVTPAEGSAEQHVLAIEQFWMSLGSRIVRMAPDEHDRAVAAVSHVPHLVASALAAATEREDLPLAAGGWRDTTRVASGDVELWRQILTENRPHVLQSLMSFEKVLSEFRQALQQNDAAAITRLLDAGKQNRDALGS